MDWLRLSDNTAGPRYFVNESGKPVNFFGMARCQGCCTTELKNYGGPCGVAKHFKDLGCNIIRLSIHVRGQTYERHDWPAGDMIELCGGYNEIGINRFIDMFVDPEVREIEKQGMYIELDLHDYPPTNIDEEIVQFAYNHYIPVWRELAKRYKDDPMIAVYEIWNEPYPADVATALKDSPEWVKGIREFFFEAVKAIREIDQKHVIMASDYNAGWGQAWDICWKDYHKDLDPYNNTCFSIHLSGKQLDREAPDYMDWYVKRMDEENICLFAGEIETEGNLNTLQGMLNLVDVLKKYEATHHIPAVLWRPHDDESNYVKYWVDFAREYTAK